MADILLVAFVLASVAILLRRGHERRVSRRRVLEQARGQAHELPAMLPLPDAAELPGADPSRPIHVRSPAVIEGRAERWPCPVCEGDMRSQGQQVETLGGRRLRVVQLRCVRCGFARPAYFSLEQPSSGQGEAPN